MVVNLNASLGRLRGRPTLNIVALELICVALALIEGLACAAVFMLVAIGYHSTILHVDLASQSIGLFIAFAVTTGAIYAAFSIEAFSRLIERKDRLIETLTKSVSSWTVAYGVALLMAFGAGVAGDLSRVSIFVAFLGGVPIAIVLRAGLSRQLETRIAAGALQFQKVGVVGRREHVTQYLSRSNIWRHGRNLAGAMFLEDAVFPDGSIDEQRVLDFANISVAGGIETIIFIADDHTLDASRPLIDMLRRFSINIDLAPVSLSRFRILSVVHIGATAGLRIASKPLRGRALALKRLLDVTGAILGLVLSMPLLFWAALAIWVETRGPIIFRQERRGFNGSTFMIWKFRTMRVAEAGTSISQARRGDDRITRVGRFLRATSIDELPQLINVLVGDMSLVGPRPHAVGHDAELIGKLDEYAYRNRLKPGITGWAQVNGHRGEIRTPEQIEARAQHDLYYIDNWTIFLDIWVILLTVFSPRTHRGVF